jgi:hypothetical protein
MDANSKSTFPDDYMTVKCYLNFLNVVAKDNERWYRQMELAYYP